MGESADAVPRVVGRYEILDEIASGGMATVYLGRIIGSGGFSRTVAIKRLHPQFAKNPEFVTMFLDEARLAARIRHPNVVPTLDVVAASGELFLVMEYVEGETLSRLARRLKERGQRVPMPVLMRIMADALQGLHAAHEARDERGVPLNIVHRDVTPQNILVGIDGVSRLLDFGVAKAAGRAQTTQEGQIKGKLAYMAPEQLMSSGVTRETDLYAASVILWEMLTGARLVTGESEVDLVANLLKRDIHPPSRLVAEVPKELDALVMRGLAAKAADRFPTAREMCVALSRCGIREEPSIAVAEWVATLALESLTRRMARVAALESQSGSDTGPGESTRTALTLGGGPITDVTRVTGADFGPTSIQDRLSSDPPSAAASATLNTGALHAGSTRRKARARVLGGAAMVALVLVCGALALARSMRVRPPAPVTLRDTPGLQETRGAEMTSAVLAHDVLPTLPLPSSATSVAVAPRKDPRPDSTSSHRAGPALPARARPQPALPVPSDDQDNVFKTRE
jgi:eukaryotic-like serine/threonine-protein kinase